LIVSRAALQKLFVAASATLLTQKTGWKTFDPASQAYGPDEVRRERQRYGNTAGMR
jgi:hypothetical protein